MQRTYIRNRAVQKRHLRNSRIIAAGIFVIVVVIVASLALSPAVQASHTIDFGNTEQGQTIYVEEGDNLWGIAKEYYHGYHGDIRKVVYTIEKANNLNKANIYIGQKLYLPNAIYNNI